MSVPSGTLPALALKPTFVNRLNSMSYPNSTTNTLGRISGYLNILLRTLGTLTRKNSPNVELYGFRFLVRYPSDSDKISQISTNLTRLALDKFL